MFDQNTYDFDYRVVAISFYYEWKFRSVWSSLSIYQELWGIINNQILVI